jgi:hypothetical protein
MQATESACATLSSSEATKLVYLVRNEIFTLSIAFTMPLLCQMNHPGFGAILATGAITMIKALRIKPLLEAIRQEQKDQAEKLETLVRSEIGEVKEELRSQREILSRHLEYHAGHLV